MATADLGAIEICGLLSLSPLMDLLRACIARFMLATVRTETTELRFEHARDILLRSAVQRHIPKNGYDKNEKQMQGMRGEEISRLMAHLHRRTSCL